VENHRLKWEENPKIWDEEDVKEPSQPKFKLVGEVQDMIYIIL
jgi:hypothetical protein